jgi:hypothetical protein
MTWRGGSEVEHVLYPRVVEAVAAGRIQLGDDNRVVFNDRRRTCPTSARRWMFRRPRFSTRLRDARALRASDSSLP